MVSVLLRTGIDCESAASSRAHRAPVASSPWKGWPEIQRTRGCSCGERASRHHRGTQAAASYTHRALAPSATKALRCKREKPYLAYRHLAQGACAPMTACRAPWGGTPRNLAPQLSAPRTQLDCQALTAVITGASAPEHTAATSASR